MLSSQQNKTQKIQLSFQQKIGLLVPYVKSRVVAQIKAVILIVLYLILFQTIVLDIRMQAAGVIALGISTVIIGLAFFMEGLLLGIMPLGERIGVQLPQKSKLPVILLFSFILGVGATYAEPAISVLKASGSFIRAWDAPLMFFLLNKYSDYLVYGVGAGVGIAVIFGMLRFLYEWSLKPFLYLLIGILLGFSVWAFFDPNMRSMTGLAWDCGAVTTGPVTVPLVLALGIGVCRIIGGAKMENAGFGVVTLASLFPVVAVLILGASQLHKVPSPMNQEEFFRKETRDSVLPLFHDKDAMIGYAFQKADTHSQIAMFEGDRERMLNFIRQMKTDENLRISVFGTGDPDTLRKWALERGSEEQRMAVFEDPEKLKSAFRTYFTKNATLNFTDITVRNGISAFQAIIPLTLFLLLVLTFMLREKLPEADKVFLGICVALVGMTLFNIGNELGLTKLGKHVGSKLPSSFTRIDLPQEMHVFTKFDQNVVQTAINDTGIKEQYFIANIEGEYVQVPFRASQYDSANNQYLYTPTKGPLFGGRQNVRGYLVVLLFAFIMGYGATLAEPALNALGMKVEEITIGTFKKSVLIQAVAIGVGIGMTCGVVKIIWDVPLIWLLGPPYILLLYLTKVSSEQFVNIGWDSAGVTTGPITVPLVLAMGLGISGQVDVIEGFGILAMASVYPILTFLLVGLYMKRRIREFQGEAG